jgi:fructose-1,6-bisphosphatase/inositol monophosphatase family enzyme
MGLTDQLGDPEAKAASSKVLPAISAVAELVTNWFGFDEEHDQDIYSETIAAAVAVVAGGLILKSAWNQLHSCKESASLRVSPEGDTGSAAALSSSHQTIVVASKASSADIVTDVDRQVEHEIRRILLTAFPEYAFVGEESAYLSNDIPLDSAKSGIGAWVVDPLDGTTNFVSGIPHICTAVALIREHHVHVGAVYNPITDDLWAAVRHRGAFLNGKRLYAQCHVPLSDAVVVTEFGYERSSEGARRICSVVERLLCERVRAIRMFGSGILDLLFAAQGVVNVVYAGVAGEGWQPWDYAAGVLIAKEAGCAVASLEAPLDLSGDDEFLSRCIHDFDIFGKSVLCASSRDLALEVYHVIREACSS